MPNSRSGERSGQQDFLLSNIRFEPETGGYCTIWFDLGGPAFAEPEAMKNMFVEFQAFLEFLQHEYPEALPVLPAAPGSDEAWVERLDAGAFDWAAQLRRYIDQRIDLAAAEKERRGWLKNRRSQAAPSEADRAWEKLSAQADAAPRPSWDDVVHALIDNLNETAIELFPELMQYSPEDNATLREIFESHGERLANQLVALTDRVRKEAG